MSQPYFTANYTFPTGERKKFFTVCGYTDDDGRKGVAPVDKGNAAHKYDPETGAKGLFWRNSTCPDCQGWVIGRLMEELEITDAPGVQSWGNGAQVASNLAKNSHSFLTKKGYYFDKITDYNDIQPGDIVSFGGGDYGHVVFVEYVDSTGITFTESNYYSNPRFKCKKFQSFREYGSMRFVAGARLRGGWDFRYNRRKR